MAVVPVLLAVVVATGADGVPSETVARAKVLVERVLQGVDGDVSLRLFATRQAMHAAIRETDPRAPADFAAYYQYRSQTIFAYLAPRPDPALWRGRLTGLLAGALVHEAQHARGALEDRAAYRARPAWRIEGEADRDAVRFLERSGLPGAGAWRLQLESAVFRARRRGLFGASDAWKDLAPHGLDPAQRATFYARAYDTAAGPRPAPPWILWRGSAEPRDDGYRLVSETGRPALLLRRKGGPIDVQVTPLDIGKGQIEILHSFRSAANYLKVAFLRRGGVRTMTKKKGEWHKGPLHTSPPIPAGETVRLTLRGRDVFIDETLLLRLRTMPTGRCGIGVHDGAADFVIR